MNDPDPYYDYSPEFQSALNPKRVPENPSMKIDWYDSNGVVCVAWIGPFHFTVTQWHKGDDYNVKNEGVAVFATFPPNMARSDIQRFMVGYAKIKLAKYLEEIAEYELTNPEHKV